LLLSSCEAFLNLAGGPRAKFLDQKHLAIVGIFHLPIQRNVSQKKPYSSTSITLYRPRHRVRPIRDDGGGDARGREVLGPAREVAPAPVLAPEQEREAAPVAGLVLGRVQAQEPAAD
jgi:hypothetical protein